MKRIFFLSVICLLILITESAHRSRRQYNGYGYAQQYGAQYGLYGPGGQGWMNNNNNNINNANPNVPGYGWNNNLNWNQGNQYPEWYYNTSNTIQCSILCFLLLVMYILLV